MTSPTRQSLAAAEAEVFRLQKEKTDACIAWTEVNDRLAQVGKERDEARAENASGVLFMAKQTEEYLACQKSLTTAEAELVELRAALKQIENMGFATPNDTAYQMVAIARSASQQEGRG